MTARSRLFTIVSILLLCSFFVSSASAAPAAQTGTPYPPEFRDVYTRYMAWLDVSSPGLKLEERVQAMSDEEFQALYDSFAEPEKIVALMEQAMSPTSTRQSLRSRNLVTPQLTPLNAPQLNMSTGLYQPDYPIGLHYDELVAALLVNGYLADLDGNGTTANDRCNTDKVASNESLKIYFEGAAIFADVLCNSIVVILGEGTNGPFCVAAGAAHGAVLAEETTINKCSFQDGSVDSAELEAAYENLMLISSQVDVVGTKVEDMATTLGDVSIQLVDISTQIDDLSTQLQTHDTDIKTILDANQAQSIRIEIEQALSDTNDNVRVSYFYLPQAQGGLLETVREVVLDAINANALAGLSTGTAQAWFARAEASYASKDYKSAYDLYGKAYRELVK